ncbi:MAG: sugar ABC transporter substrate-binding protein [Oceanospirillum sp.]|nr:sugar ABC transporter substrate-binding protein [Oceanospirillum sp.]
MGICAMWQWVGLFRMAVLTRVAHVFRILHVSQTILGPMVLIALLCLAFPVWAGSLQVSFINPGKQGERFWDMVTATMQAAADDLDIELKVYYAQRNRIRMQAIGSQLLTEKQLPDYLVLVNEEQSAEEIVKMANEKQVKTLLLLNDFFGSQLERMGQPREKYPYWIGSITPDNYRAGFRMADRIIERAKQRFGTPVHLLAIAGDKVTPASILRTEGMLKRVQADPDVILDRLLYANWNARDAKVMTERYLQWAERNQIHPHSLWAANDPIAAGAIKALREKGLEPGKDIFLAGLNWSPEGLDMVQSGDLVLTDGGHFLAGAWTMVLLRDYAEGFDFAQQGYRLSFPMSAIDKRNIERFMQVFAERDWRKVDFSYFSRWKNPRLQQYPFELEHLIKAVAD